MNAPRSNQRAVEKIDAILAMLDKGSSKEEREARLRSLERIASLVRARRSKSEAPQSTRVRPPKAVLAENCLQIVDELS
jgi:hypothetical protein